jgi:hypothetical protein
LLGHPINMLLLILVLPLNILFQNDIFDFFMQFHVRTK